MRLPQLTGDPIEVCFRAERGRVYAGAFLRERRISLDPALRRDRAELARIFTHELMHFAWLRLGNPLRRSYEQLLASELRSGTGGELGWSAERRKLLLGHRDIRERSREWRLYCCESFCDTGAWLFSGLAAHPEFTLPARARRLRRRWFSGAGLERELRI